MRSTDSPRRGITRTSLDLTLLAGPAPTPKRGMSRLAYHFEGTAPPSFLRESAEQSWPRKEYRNPIALARAWHRALGDGECPSRADLARQLGVSRARVTQVLGLLSLAPEVLDAIAALGDPLPRPIVTERLLRPLLKLPASEQRRILRNAGRR